MGGRGSGKTRTGAEWIRAQVAAHGKSRIALIAPTINDAREVMIEGESGLRNIGYPSERPNFIASRRRLEWPNGAVGHVFTAEDPDGLRGPQFDAAWADEFCAWSYPAETLSNLRLALRLGDFPQLVVTTTPQPLPELKALLKAAGILITQGRTADNADYLAPNFMSAMNEAYGGTRLGRQELNGEFIEDLPGALWTRDMLERAYTTALPKMSKIILAIDPPVTSGERSDACGLIVAGTLGEGRAAKVYILHDGTVQGRSPEGWARAAIKLAHGWDVDYVLAEVNQGGELVTSVLRMFDPHIAIRTVHASQGKTARAEPVAALYEQGRVLHGGRFTALEDELAAMGTASLRKSPDRADALVWAVTELLFNPALYPVVGSYNVNLLFYYRRTIEWVIIIVIIAGLCRLAFRDKSFVPPKTAPSDERTYASFEMADSLFVNRSETAFFQILNRKLPAGYHLHSKTRLEDIIRVKPSIKGQAHWHLRGRVKSRHVDYLITDRNGIPKAVIELDGSSHNKEAFAADTLKDGLFKAAGLPLIRVRTASDFHQAATRIIATL